jgi:hypothetical protein
MADELVVIGNPQPSGAASVGVMTQERPSATVAAALTVDPSTTNPGTFTFTSTAVFSTAYGTGQFKIKVENEIGLATVASGTTLTVIRGQDGTTNAAHAIGKTVAALGLAQYVVPMSNRSVSFCGCAASWRTVGSAGSPHVLFSIENQAGSAVIVGVSKLTIEMDSTAALATVAADIETYRPTSIASAGTVLTKTAIDTALTSNASVVLRGATASHGGAATAITAAAPSTSPMWHQFAYRMHTAVGVTDASDYNMLPSDIADVDWVPIRAGESLAVRVVGTATNNPATNFYVVKCAFFEYTVP